MTRALVLGGGGPVGIAWESGLLAGLAEAGLDVSGADFLMGTSAGSVVGAQLALGRTPAQLYQAITAQPLQPPRPDNDNTGNDAPATTPLMDLMQKAADEHASPEELRRQIGAFALAAETISEDQFLPSFGRLIAQSDAWPARAYACTAVDAITGEFVLWDAASNVPLNRAVASSCSVPGIYPPVTINGRRYIDGGMRSATNADCATGHDTVLVVAVTANAKGPMAERSHHQLQAELESLRRAGQAVECIQPDEAALEVFGLNLMDFSRRTPAAHAGYAQGKAAAQTLAAHWASA